jgi:hypothetical protein
VNEQCAAVRRRLETEGSVPHADLQAHLDACAQCRAHAALLAVLGRLEAPEASEETVHRIVAALPPAPWQRRRLAAWLPLAAGLALVAASLALSGGIPALATMSSLSGAVGGVLGWIVASALDALAAARGSTDAAQAVVAAGGVWLLLWLVTAALGGSWAVVSLVKRSRGERQQ